MPDISIKCCICDKGLRDINKVYVRTIENMRGYTCISCYEMLGTSLAQYIKNEKHMKQLNSENKESEKLLNE